MVSDGNCRIAVNFAMLQVRCGSLVTAQDRLLYGDRWRHGVEPGVHIFLG